MPEVPETPGTATYTYDPTRLSAKGKDRMRFELGDTVIDRGPMTSPLCDQEYEAILAEEPSWKKAKFRCLQAICMKLSYEVDTSIAGLSYSLNQRAERWQEMLKAAKKEMAALSVPLADPRALGPKDGELYFHTDMHRNPRR